MAFHFSSNSYLIYQSIDLQWILIIILIIILHTWSFSPDSLRNTAVRDRPAGLLSVVVQAVRHTVLGSAIHNDAPLPVRSAELAQQ